MNDVLSLLKEGVKHHTAGRLKEAEDLYMKVLDMQPDHPDALNLLGLAANASRSHFLSEQLIRRAMAISPSRADYLYNLGVVLSSTGKQNQAMDFYQKAVLLDPKYPEPYVNMGVILQKQGNLEAAIEMLEKAVALKPDFSEALYNLGNVLYEKGDSARAMDSMKKAIHFNPNYGEAIFNLGVMARRAGNTEESYACFRKILLLNPGHEEAHFQMGLIRYSQGRIEDAHHYFRETVRLKPNHVKALNNIGHILQEQGGYDEAISIYKRALAHAPTDPDTHFNLGTAFQFRGYVKEASESFTRSLTLFPENPSALFARAETFLAMGELEAGFRDYQARLRVDKWKSKYPVLPGITEWDGTSLDGKTILVRGEQGFGDTIQFARYLPQVKEKGGYVIFEIKEPVFSLFEDYPGVDRFLLKSTSPDLAGVDCYTHLLSLPYLFKTTLSSIPEGVPFRYDRSKRKTWLLKEGEEKGMRVGFVWAGLPAHLNDRNRSCPFHHFSSLFDIKEISFFSLQKGNTGNDLVSSCGRENVYDLSPDIVDFLDTALAIELLDLVITVDTSVAHLSGTLGKPTWVLLPFAPDFRWLLERETSPWYPSLRLFRQPSFGRWEEVFVTVRNELYKIIHEPPTGRLMEV